MPIFYENYYKDYMNKGEIVCIPISVPTPNGTINLFLPLINNELVCGIDVQTVEDTYEIVLKDEWVCFYYPMNNTYVYIGFDKSYDTVHALTKTARFFVPKSLFDNPNDPIVEQFLNQLIEHLQHFVESTGRNPKSQVVNSLSVIKLIKTGNL